MAASVAINLQPIDEINVTDLDFPSDFVFSMRNTNETNHRPRVGVCIAICLVMLSLMAAKLVFT